ncbi:MAG: bifunctional DNA-formamidopyrimidine glycosylase/DNA-(apurinic or apyrimidinic site) lyase [Desulfopila sp.]
MPELPEVETICRGIRPQVVGQRIVHIDSSGKKLRAEVPIEILRQRLPGQTIVGVQRRAKYLLMEIEDGSLLVIHLGMTGNLGVFPGDSAVGKHCHLRLFFSDDRELRYTDARRFGAIQFFDTEAAPTIENTLFRTTGPEPFSDAFNASYLLKMSHNRSVAVKAFIMTNQVVAGVGNIYANESLFMAGISPHRKVSAISRHDWQMLITSIREVLAHAIACGGSTISDYVNAEQKSGYFQINFQVYGRDGQQCPRCETVLVKQYIGGRASYSCPSCQR